MKIKPLQNVLNNETFRSHLYYITFRPNQVNDQINMTLTLQDRETSRPFSLGLLIDRYKSYNKLIIHWRFSILVLTLEPDLLVKDYLSIILSDKVFIELGFQLIPNDFKVADIISN